MHKNFKVAFLMGLLLVAVAVGYFYNTVFRLSLYVGSIEVHAWVGSLEVTANAKITKGSLLSVYPLGESYSHYTPYTFPSLSNGYWFLEVKYQDQPTQSKGITINNNGFREDFYFDSSNTGTLEIHAYVDNGDVGASITIDGVTGSWTTGVIITLNANAYTVHAHFLSYPDKTENVTVYANQKVGLAFYWYSSQVTYILTVTAGNGGDTNANGANYLEQGGSIDVTAAPRQGFNFSYWSLDGVNKDGNTTYHFVQSDQQNHVLTAVFTYASSGGIPDFSAYAVPAIAVVLVFVAVIAVVRARRRQ